MEENIFEMLCVYYSHDHFLLNFKRKMHYNREQTISNMMMMLNKTHYHK